MDGPFLVQKFMKFWTMRLVGTKNGELLDYCNSRVPLSIGYSAWKW